MNKLIFYYCLISICISVSVTIDNNPCNDDTPLSDCTEKDYESYYQCIESQKLIREKRELCLTNMTKDSIDNITISCQKKNIDCRFDCNGNATCESQCPVCPVFVEEQPDYGRRTVIIEGNNPNDTEKIETKIEAGHNVTTVIKLTNLIHNNNTIHVPTNVSTTNLNNIHIYPNNRSLTNDTGGEFGLGYNERGSCCIISRPKSCVQTTLGRRCNYQRKKTCGPRCTSRTIHVSSKKQSKHGRYIPQPKSQPCVYIDQWPFVSCGGQFGGSCDGCYEYENNELENSQERSDQCQGCYDEGFDYGPLYRRGPVLRPFYYHMVPCYIVGMCYPVAMPAFLPSNAYDQFEFEYDENFDKNSSIDDNDDWQTDIYKCKVVSDDGTIEIKNCTGTNLEGNPYATYPLNTEIPSSNQQQRLSRHVGNGRRRGNLRNAIVFDDSSPKWNRPKQNRKNRQNNKRGGKHQRRKPKVIFEDEEN